jgi:hypothetical protein
LDRLYELPPDQFVDARGALRKELRATGNRDEADWVGRLRKPTVAAGTVNRLVRSEQGRVAVLLEAGERLRGAQEGLAQGTADAGELRQAGEEERRSVSDLVAAARELEAAEAPSATVLERVGDTLHAATLDEDVRRRVEAARVTREAAAVGFGGLTAAAPAARPARKVSKGDPGKAADDQQARERERSARFGLDAAEARLESEKEAFSDARNAVRLAKRERDRLQKRLEAEEAQLDETRARVERLTEEAKKARRRVAELRRRGSRG